MPSDSDTVLLIACSVAIGSLVPVALFQLGAIPRLPDPPGSIFRSEAITASAVAHPFGMPDSLPGIVSYSATFALIVGARHSPRLQPLLASKLALDGALVGFNVVRQMAVFRRLCSWCMLTAGATAVMVYAGRNRIGQAAAQLSASALQALPDEDAAEPILDALSPHG